MITVTIPVSAGSAFYVPVIVPDATQIPPIAAYQSAVDGVAIVGGSILSSPTTFAAADLVSVSGLNLSGNPDLVTVTLTNLASADLFYFNDCTSLEDIDGLDSLTVLTSYFVGANCAWSQSFVNRILHILVNCTTDGSTPWASTLDLTLGNSSAPSGQGVADATTLRNRGATINTN